ncbi:hypothetical protein SAMN05216326_12027 [Nitrosomonas marina]|uniref:Uncharacterized protein n=1 Tax=Nitrosomonas marina TaxID=917 RepID=A0A1I0DJT0_9PROT|nr:hypothetical protein [Nitrosomonas marina]SET31902.1 hypothetical protein SAMN05216326_12027 [Nitrosomonas marina]
MELEKLVTIVSGAVAVIATVAGGVWGYYRFHKSRSFEPRLILDVKADLVRSLSDSSLLCTFDVKNVGLSKVDIEKAYARLGIIQGNGKRKHLTTRKVLLAHSWLEPGTTLKEQELISCPECHGAVKIEFRLVAAGIAYKTTHILQLPEINARLKQDGSRSSTQFTKGDTNS